MKPNDTELAARIVDLIEHGDVPAVAALLLANPAAVLVTTKDGDTPLHIACWQKQIGIVATIVAYEPDLNARGCYGRTPLHYAVHEGRAISVPIVGFLVSLGADPLIKDDKGFSVEDWAKIEMTEGLAEVLAILRRSGRKQP